MLDRVTGIWPGGGPAGLGRCAPRRTSTRRVVLQGALLPGPGAARLARPRGDAPAAAVRHDRARMGEGIAGAALRAARARGRALTWKYRGQVVPQNRTVHTTIEITARSAGTSAGASPIADGSPLGRRQAHLRGEEPRHAHRRRAAPDGRGGETRDRPRPGVDPWLADHRPTWTVPALPMMSMVDRLARGADGRRARVTRPARTCACAAGSSSTGRGALRSARPTASRPARSRRRRDGGGEVAPSRVAARRRTRRRRRRRAPRPLAASSPRRPLRDGALFHGPAFQVAERARHGRGAVLEPARAPARRPRAACSTRALLDGATHGIPHDGSTPGATRPTRARSPTRTVIPEIASSAAAASRGASACEIALRGLRRERPLPGLRHPARSAADGVWCQLRLVEVLFPKGPLGSAPPAARRAFLRDRRFVPGLRLSRVEARRHAS